MQIAEGLKNSVTLGVGQFCTKPGVVVCLDDAATQAFIEELMRRMADCRRGDDAQSRNCQTRLRRGAGGLPAIGQSIDPICRRRRYSGQSSPRRPSSSSQDHRWREELFGPATVVVVATVRRGSLRKSPLALRGN